MPNKAVIFTEYTIIPQEGVGMTYYVIKLGDGLYYARGNQDGVKATREIGFASRIVNETYAREVIDWLRYFFDETGAIIESRRHDIREI